MKRFFSALFLIFIFAFVIPWLYRAPIASYLITRGSGVEVSIKSLAVSLDGLTAYQVRAHEPRTVTTLTFGKVDIQTDLFRLFNPVVTIKHVQLDNVTVQSDPGKIDLQDLGSLFQRKKTSPEEPSTKKAKKFVIESVEATNIQVQVQNPFSDQLLLSANVPEARFSKLNRGNPMTLEEALGFLTKQFQLLKNQ